MMSTTHKQAELLTFLAHYLEDSGGVSPSFGEMRDALGLSSKSGIHRLITALEERGKIARIPHRTRAIRIIAKDPFAGVPTAELWAELQRRGEVRRAA